MIHNIPQPVFEQFLTDVLAKDPNVDIRKGVSFVSLTQVSAGTVPGQVQMLSIRILRELSRLSRSVLLVTNSKSVPDISLRVMGRGAKCVMYLELKVTEKILVGHHCHGTFTMLTFQMKQ